MKVAFDACAASDPRGIGRYVRCLLAALRETAGEHTIVESHRPARGQLFHAPWIDGAHLRSGVPQVVTVHDLVPLKRRSEYLRTGLRFRLRYLAIQRAERVIVPTRAVAEDLIALLDVPEERIRVIGEAAAAAMRPRGREEVAAVRERYGLPQEYLLWVGGLEHPDPRKRVAALARAPRELPLVLAGPAGRWARELPDVLLPGRVDDEELAALYTGARALVFASDDEGFGLPPVEALACGTPVACCEVPALREVLEERASFVPVDDLAGLIATGEAARRPTPAPPAFTWEDAAVATWQVYEELVES
ncbi:MAG: glycosyltransferase family 4 protein [Solirubrobacteraceae bacterium]